MALGGDELIVNDIVPYYVTTIPGARFLAKPIGIPSAMNRVFWVEVILGVFLCVVEGKPTDDPNDKMMQGVAL